MTSARPGLEYWTLRCAQCGLIHEAQVNAEPMRYRPGAQLPESAAARTAT